MHSKKKRLEKAQNKKKKKKKKQTKANSIFDTNIRMRMQNRLHTYRCTYIHTCM